MMAAAGFSPPFVHSLPPVPILQPSVKSRSVLQSEWDAPLLFSPASPGRGVKAKRTEREEKGAGAKERKSGEKRKEEKQT